MASNNNIKEVVVVEGYHDLAKLRSIFPDLDIEITNGSEISVETLQRLKRLNEKRGLILFLDPDFQGERIRRLINDFVGPTKHAYVTKKDAQNKTKSKVGVEHANSSTIKEVLENVFTTDSTNKSDIELSDLYRLKLIGNPHSKELRKHLGERLGIGLNNGKTLYRKLHMHGITLSQIEAKLKG